MEKKEDQVWVTIKRTINLGNYENITVEAGMQSSPKGSDTQPELLEELCDTVWEIVLERSKEYKRVLKPKKSRED